MRYLFIAFQQQCDAGCAETLDLSAALSSECLSATTDTLAHVADLSPRERVEAYNSSALPENYPCKAGDDSVRSAWF